MMGMQNGITPMQGNLAASSKMPYAFTLWPAKPFLGICTKGKPEKVYMNYAYKEDYLLGCILSRKIEEIICMYVDLCWEILIFVQSLAPLDHLDPCFTKCEVPNTR